MNPRKLGWKGLAAYTGLFLVFFAICWQCVLSDGASPIWATDGLLQHYPFMVYLGRWVRESLAALFTGAPVQSFDFALGFGEDILAQLNYYGFGDPVLMLVGAAFPGAGSELGYFVLMVLKGWCAGLACMALASHLGMDRKSTLLSGLLYAFSLGLFSAAQIRQAMFINPYMHFPLMLLGVEHVFEKKRPWLLSLAVMLSALCGFYFLYCNSLLMLLYALVRQLTRGEEHPWRTLPGTAARAIGWYALGIGLSAVVFIPATIGFLNGQRTGTLSLDGMRLFYSLREYLRMPLSLTTSRSSGAVQMMPALSLFGAAVLLLRWRREDRSLRAVVAAATVLALIPASGWVLNGFTYEATRWSYALSLLAALLGGFGLNAALSLTKKEKILLAGLTGAFMIYYVVAVLMGWTGSRWNVVLPALAMVATLIALYLLPKLNERGGWRRRLGALTLSVVLLFNLTTAFSAMWKGRRAEMMPFGESQRRIDNSVYDALPEADGFGRTDVTVDAAGEMLNSSALEGIPGTTVYNSTLSGSTFRLLEDVNSAGLVQLNSIIGLDRRAALEALWSVDRYVVQTDSRISPPYGFTEGSDGIWENQYALPLGSAVTQAITTEEYEALSPLERQWALLSCAVLDEIPEGLPHTLPEQSVHEIEITSVEMEDIVADGDRLQVGDDAVIRLTFDAPADCELYIELERLAFPDGEVDPNNRVYFTSGDAGAECYLMRDGFMFDLNREFMLVNIGYDDAARTTAEIRFARTGSYRLKGMKLYAQPMSDFPALIAARQEKGLTDVTVGTDELTGTTNLSEPGVMVFGIPYSTGWTVCVDGEKVDALASADALLAAVVPAGEHEIHLTYTTPGLIPGALISALSLVGLAAAMLLSRRRTKGEKA